jgi:hypothetical protein
LIGPISRSSLDRETIDPQGARQSKCRCSFALMRSASEEALSAFLIYLPQTTKPALGSWLADTFPPRCQPSRINCAAHFASRAAFWFPSPADTIDPFIKICRACANFSGSYSFASSARPGTMARMFARWIVAARRTGLSALDSNKTLMKEHPSKDFLWNQPPNTSKIASRRASGSMRGVLFPIPTNRGSIPFLADQETRSQAQLWS